LVSGCPERRSAPARRRTAVRRAHGREHRRNPLEPRPDGLAPKRGRGPHREGRRCSRCAGRDSMKHPVALKPRRRDREMKQPGKPISAAHAEAVHLSKMKRATVVTAVCATALVVLTLAGRSTAAPAKTTLAKP